MKKSGLVNSEDTSQEISINLKEKTFADFILNFLGKKEKISYQKNCSFLLHHNDIEQFYYLLDSKLQKERNLIVDHFLVTVSYNDNTTRELSGIENLKSFQETRHVFPVSITLTWNIITNFPSSNTIENQTVELTFLTGIKDTRRSNDAKDEGKVILTIHHTNQAWGIEVLNLFKDAMNNVSIEKPKAYYFIRGMKSIINKDVIFFTFMALFLLSSVYINTHTDHKINSAMYYKIAEAGLENRSEMDISLLAFAGMDSMEINKVADNLISTKEIRDALKRVAIAKDEMANVETLAIRSGVLLIIFIISNFFYSLYAMSFYGSNSHILLTKRAENNKQTEFESKSKATFYSVSALIFALISGLLVEAIKLVISL